jgi:hypothetical protein
MKSFFDSGGRTSCTSALGAYLLMPLPRWVSSEDARDNWQSML